MTKPVRKLPPVVLLQRHTIEQAHSLLYDLRHPALQKDPVRGAKLTQAADALAAALSTGLDQDTRRAMTNAEALLHPNGFPE